MRGDRIRPDNPLIVQGDLSVLVEVASPRYGEARDALVGFAELVKSPEHIHTYQVTPLSIWNARAAGLTPEAITEALREYAKYPVPDHVVQQILAFGSRYGKVRLEAGEDDRMLVLSCDEVPLAEELSRHRDVASHLGVRRSDRTFGVEPGSRGLLKQALVKAGWPAEDLAGYVEGDPLAVRLRDETRGGEPFSLRPYQREAVAAFHAGGASRGGSGVVVLPCGAGKTLVGMGCMAELSTSTLILTTGVTATRQWIQELLERTSLRPEDIGEYTGETKSIRPVTIATYQILTHRPTKKAPFTHLDLFDRRGWGLIIYDEVHLLPAPVFRVTASLQARRRLGLTATLVREDGREDDVFALIGPKKLDLPWKLLERQGWIASAECVEVRLPLPPELRMPYAVADARRRFRVAAENPSKVDVVREILTRHTGEPTLIMAMYVDQIRGLARELGVPVVTGSTSQATRERLYEGFRAGDVPVLAVSKVANFAVDLPDASVAVQISGTFGSRQEEAQRLGRLLRPKPGRNQAHFYTLVSRDTVEQDFALKRQRFLCEQGYGYRIVDGAPGTGGAGTAPGTGGAETAPGTGGAETAPDGERDGGASRTDDPGSAGTDRGGTARPTHLRLVR